MIYRIAKYIDRFLTIYVILTYSTMHASIIYFLIFLKARYK
ncbi:hypothetical protein [Brachyspira aalborgi]|nr:hypothetical protein [Brachyspira aalborgi]